MFNDRSYPSPSMQATKVSSARRKQAVGSAVHARILALSDRLWSADSWAYQIGVSLDLQLIASFEKTLVQMICHCHIQAAGRRTMRDQAEEALTAELTIAEEANQQPLPPRLH